MILNSLQLYQFRNYEQIELAFDSPVNLFIGQNAQGKTNLLESIYALALSKSHRTHKDKELIRWGAKQARISAEIEKKYGPCRLDLLLASSGKRAKINGLEQKKLSDFIGTLNVVMFAPEDLDIVKGAPGIRRRFMDMEIAQVEPRYLYHLTRFQKVLQQRNLYLKQQRDPNAIDLGMLEVWDRQLAEHGSKIMKKRQNFISKLQIVAAQIHDSITEGKERLKIVYQPSVESEDFADETVLFERFMLKLSQIRMQEIRRGITLAGPHRDDILFYINDKEAGTYGSQGQQRTTALSVKLAEIELMKDEIGEYPVLLLDDVLSELDRSRQMRLIETFKDKVQTFITATEIDSIDKNRLGDARIFRVVDGRVLK